jgi:hypothetical protein
MRRNPRERVALRHVLAHLESRAPPKDRLETRTSRPTMIQAERRKPPGSGATTCCPDAKNV